MVRTALERDHNGRGYIGAETELEGSKRVKKKQQKENKSLTDVDLWSDRRSLKKVARLNWKKEKRKRKR